MSAKEWDISAGNTAASLPDDGRDLEFVVEPLGVARPGEGGAVGEVGLRDVQVLRPEGLSESPGALAVVQPVDIRRAGSLEAPSPRPILRSTNVASWKSNSREWETRATVWLRPLRDT